MLKLFPMFQYNSIKALLPIFMMFFCSWQTVSPHGPSSQTMELPFGLKDTHWVDSVFKTMSNQEKIGQLFMVAAYSNKGQQHINDLQQLITQNHIGGLIFFQGGPVRQAHITNKLQSVSKIPMMIAMDAEWGLSMRLDSTIAYPKQMMLGAIEDESLVEKMGNDLAQQCRRLGVHINFAPVVDVNNNPKNPVINARSFGENKENVSRLALSYIRGLQSGQVMACAKHFPGHGDTESDSHKTLPVVGHNRQRLEDIELYPFKKCIDQGVSSIMVAHLFVPSLDSTSGRPTTLSPEVVTGLLKNNMGFKGLVFTDALNMKGVSNFLIPGEVDLQAFLAGNDVLLFSEDVPKAIALIEGALKEGKITQNELDQRCKKILAAKKWLGLDEIKPIEIKNLYKDLNKAEYYFTKRKIIEQAITVIKNDKNLIPLKRLDTLKIASLAIGETGENQFQKTMDAFAKVDHFQISKNPEKADLDALLQRLKQYSIVLIGLHGSNENPSKNFGFSTPSIQMIQSIQKNSKTVVALFGNPYAIEKLTGLEKSDALLVAYQDMDLIQDYTAQLIFGAFKAKGKLPISASPSFPFGTGLSWNGSTRMMHTVPQEFGIPETHLAKIDSLIYKAIRDEAFPGCQILAAKEGRIFYNKSFGHHMYDSVTEVKSSDLYDLASITKISATLLGIMELQDNGRLNLEDKLGDYLQFNSDTSPYNDIVLREMLAHQAGLVSWIPFYEKTLHRGQPKFELYSKAQSKMYNTRVAEDFYILSSYKDTILSRILETRLVEKKYRYSDLGYYFLKMIVEKQTGQEMHDYLESKFYTPLGASHLLFKPRRQYSLNDIVPTELDKVFRNQLIHGDVHDPGAAMLGGVGGHAGLFGNAMDLAKLMQMYVNMGSYGGEVYLKSSTVAEFAKCQFCEDNNRRGAGFDKPAQHGTPGPTCDCISFDSFGHSGFTGTLAWADPSENMVYIFLSNRVHPDAANKKLISSNLRSKVMRILYEGLQYNTSENKI